jgi:hypothetical protein
MAIWPCQLPRTMLQRSKYVCGETSKPRALGWLLNGLSPLERQEMPSERPYAGQLWKRDSTHVLVVTAYLHTVTYELLPGGQSVTESLDSFLAVFKRLRR